jgi:methionine aminotransferase
LYGFQIPFYTLRLLIKPKAKSQKPKAKSQRPKYQPMLSIQSKLPNVQTTIFAIMSGLANELGAINLSQGFPNFDCPRPLQDWVTHFMNKGMNQYAPMPGVPILRQRLAEKIGSLYNLDVSWEEEITVAAGATQALFCAISAVVQPGDEVIIIEPAYDSYLPVIELNGGVVRPYELKGPDFKVDWQALAGLITSKTRMIITNNPHNPTGTVFEKEDLEQLEALTRGTEIIVLSDEVYEHLTFDGKKHQSVFLYPELYKRSMVTFSFGKTFHNTGWKSGYCVAPPMLTKEFRKVHQFNVFSVNTPVQYGIAEYLKDPDTYLSLPDFYQQKRDVFQKAMEGSRFRPIHCGGTYFQLFDYSAISNEPDTEFAKRITIEFGVATIPISVFYESKRQDQVIRVCFAKTEDLLLKAASCLKKV